MEIFNAIGLEISHGKTIEDLAKNAEKQGEVSLSARAGGTIHGCCWRIGFGLEVWTTLYESKSGEIFPADCRPAFRARHTQIIKNWVLREDRKEGEAVIEGNIGSKAETVTFQLQNLTEAAAKNFQQKSLTVGLCGLAYRAKVVSDNEEPKWTALTKKNQNSRAAKTDWRLCGRVIDFSQLRNPVSNRDLYWIHLDAGSFHLEVLVNRHILKGGELAVGANVKTDVWLQGHIVNLPSSRFRYEGVDWSVDSTDFWKKFKKLN